MLTLKSSKHRCQCYSQQSGSFLYGLRRDAPSTERVLLERLLNILSRAAAHRSKNPQRLWAQSERPEWWTEVSTLPWKNPREHPKDNKETLKKKIDILERELTSRRLMTAELEEELAIHYGSKKIDLELKSDFEAIISKASGLHFMLDKVSTKMGQSRIISPKMATYISETKGCVDRIHKRINRMFEQVREREERKSDLWAAMGVSQHQRTVTQDDLVTDSFSTDPDMEVPGILEDFVSSYLSVKPESSLSPEPPYLSADTLSPPSREVSEITTLQTVYSTESTRPLPASPIDSFLLPVSSPGSSVEPPRLMECGQGSSTTVQISLSQPESRQMESEAVRAVTLSQGRSASETFSFFTKRSWLQSLDETEELALEQTKTKSRRTANQPDDYAVMIDDDWENDDHFLAKATSPGPETLQQARITPMSDNRERRDASPIAETDPVPLRSTSKQYRRFHLKQRPQSSPGDRRLICPHTVTSATSPDWWRTEATSGAATSPPKPVSNTASVNVLPSDVVEDVDFLDVEDIIEDSETATLSMYAPNKSGVEQLATMASALSCEDLSPGVTEVLKLPLQSLATPVVRPHRQPATVAGKISGNPDPLTAAVTVASPRPREKGLVKQREGVSFVLLDPGVSQQLRIAGSLRTSAERHQHQSPPQSLRTTERSRVVSSKEGNGGKSLSRAIGDLSGDFVHWK